jgi:Caspase domain
VGERHALIVATSRYEDARLRRLRAPAADAQALERVLRDPRIGDFDVSAVLDQPHATVARTLSRFFRDRRTDDTLLVHLSCHGVKDAGGELYFASVDTDTEVLDASAVASPWLREAMARSMSRRIVLMLDCCHSGAVARGMLARGEATADTKRLEGRGRAILTATDAVEYSFEGDQITGEGTPSFFTSAVVTGLESGRADRDGDGWVSVDELYEHVHDEVRKSTTYMNPRLWVLDRQGSFLIARSPRGRQRSELPGYVQALVHSPHAHERRSAVGVLAQTLGTGDSALAEAARSALQALAQDKRKTVAADARRELANHGASTQSPPPSQSGAAPVISRPTRQSLAAPMQPSGVPQQPPLATSEAVASAAHDRSESGLVREVAAALWDDHPRLTVSAPIGAGLTTLLVLGGDESLGSGGAFGAPLLVIWLVTFFALLFWLQAVLVTTVFVVRARHRTRPRR